jgi:hypothetical protein
MLPPEWGLQEGFPVFRGVPGFSPQDFARVSPLLLNKILRDQAIPMLSSTKG